MRYYTTQTAEHRGIKGLGELQKRILEVLPRDSWWTTTEINQLLKKYHRGSVLVALKQLQVRGLVSGQKTEVFSQYPRQKIRERWYWIRGNGVRFPKTDAMPMEVLV